MPDVNDEARLREAIELLYFGYREFTAGPDRILAERGLSRTHHRILYFIGRNEAVSVSELLAILAVTKQALHGPLRQLVRLDLVSNEPARHDRRVKQLRLTAGGRRLERRLTGTQMALLANVFGTAGAPATQGWREVMTVLGRS
jgi:DNA-binding MarR family transcriptional regulator